MFEPKIIFENDSYFVVDKPSGYITNEAGTTTNQPVLQTWIKENKDYPLKDSYEERNGIVHRLDKETSGILLVAKTKEAFYNLQSQIKERKIHKKYLALVHGDVEPKVGTINEPVGRLPWRRDRFGVLPGGREAVTNYKTISNHQSPISNEQLTLLELEPQTGRTHQIRIHLKHLGHPIVGDSFYAGRKTARKDRKMLNRLFLHASEIEFMDPETQKKVNFSSPIPTDLADILN
jgi:23S rRNA pseudouridine1911/1915/1917 synthase